MCVFCKFQCCAYVTCNLFALFPFILSDHDLLCLETLFSDNNLLLLLILYWYPLMTADTLNFPLTKPFF